jgi:hypothetical protein
VENNEKREKSFRDGWNRGGRKSLKFKLSEDRWFGSGRCGNDPRFGEFIVRIESDRLFEIFMMEKL